MKFLVSLSIIFSMFLVACETEQDPLKNQPDSVRDAVPQDKPDPKNPPVNERALVITVKPAFIKGFEGDTIKANISGRILMENAPGFTVDVENLPQGASFDPSTGNFEWTPGFDYVGTNMDRVDVSMNIRMYTSGAKVISKSLPVDILVYKKIHRPNIVKVSPIRSLLEGETAEFQVTVEDRDSMDNQEEHPPTLSIVNSKVDSNSYYKNGAPYVFVLNKSNNPQKGKDPFTWVYDVKVDTEDLEIVPRYATMKFGLVARSSMGVESVIEESEFRLNNKIPEPSFPWPYQDNVYFFGKQDNSFKFLISALDENARLDLVGSIQGCSSIDFNATCECRRLDSNQVDNLVCTISAKPANIEKSTTITIDVKSTNNYFPRDVETQTYKRKIKVIPTNVAPEGGDL